MHTLPTTHISPQFHVVYDESVTLVTQIASIPEDDLMDKLYEKACWSYSCDNPFPADSYHVESFCKPPVLCAKPDGHGRKHFRDPELTLTAFQTPSISNIGSPPAPETYLISDSVRITDPDTNLTSTGAVSVPEGVSPVIITGAVSVPEGVSPQMLPGSVSAPEGAPNP
jgi:hypothetical protein